MAKPHGKNLMGKEGGRDTQHWYNFIESRRVIKRSKRWDGGCPNAKPGTWYVIAVSLADKDRKFQ
jgi:hypothetical protein